MNALARGLVVAGLQVALAASVGAKLLYDRAHYPRVWVETAPYDPDLPIRGRYVRVALRVDARRQGSPGVPPAEAGGTGIFRARLEVRDGRLLAVEDPAGRRWITSGRCGEGSCWRLTEPLAYFLPEHVDDPSRRPAGEALWVEVTVPPEGPPRPIRLGVKREGAKEVSPLALRPAGGGAPRYSANP